MLYTDHSKEFMKWKEGIVKKFMDECLNMIYKVENEAVLNNEDSNPSEKYNNRTNIIRGLNFMQVGIESFLHYSVVS